MRVKIAALTLCLSLLLSGCSSLLNRSYSSETPHTQFSGEASDTDVLRAENYQGLVSAILHLVTEGQGSGVIRLYNYQGTVESDVDAACLEVTKKDPLGAYAVEYMKYNVTRVRTYYEAALTIIYRRTPEQIAAVVSVTGTNAIRSELMQTMAEYRPEVAFRVSYFNDAENAESIRQMVEDAYYDVPYAAMGMPEVTVNLYPDSGQQRLVEILLTYSGEAVLLQQRQEDLLTKAEEMTASLLAMPEEDRLTEIIEKLSTVETVQEGENCASVWSALMQNKADSEGMALAVQVLCQYASLKCELVRGTRGGQPWCWNEVCVNSRWAHLDLTREKPHLMTDAQMESRGYDWEQDGLPVCG